MPGTVVRKLECRFASGVAENSCQEFFTSMWNFFKDMETQGHCVEHARNNGSGGTGTQYHDEGSPFGTNAWAVFRFPTNANRDYEAYYLIQWNDGGTSVFGASPGAPGQIISGNGQSGGNVGIMMAYAFEADTTTTADPWNGTTGSLGSDTKGSPVWAPPVGGQVFVLPRSNDIGGGHAALKENMISLFNLTNGEDANVSRASFVGDADGVAIPVDDANNSNWGFFYCGLFDPPADPAAVFPYPALMLWSRDGNLTPGTLYGSLAGASSTDDGGVSSPVYADGVKGVTVERIGGFTDVGKHPNNAFAGLPFMGHPLEILNFEAGTIGYVGRLSFIRMVYNVLVHNTFNSLDRAILGESGGAAEVRYSYDWDGATTPGGGATRQGVDSVG